MSIVREHPVKALPFTKTYGFRKAINQRVEDYFKQTGKPKRDVPSMYAKAIFWLVFWFVAYVCLIFAPVPPVARLALCVVYAIAIGGIGLNIGHDSNHSAFSNNPRINKLLSLSMEFIGSSGFVWRHRHNVFHHTYTNISGLDEDLESNGLIRFSPNDEWKPIHRFQVFYSPFMYAFLALDFMWRDFKVYFTGRTDPLHVYPKMSRADKLTFWAGKLWYVTLMFVIPLMVFPWWQVLIGFFVITFILGSMLAAVFLPAHFVGETAFPEPVGDPLHIENEWAIHEVETTVDFAQGNRIVNFYQGGLNFQVEHHLFPQIAHANYPALSKIVKQTCEEFGVKYYAYKTWQGALLAHYRSLREFSRRPATLPAPVPVVAK